jgi:hypothetical protein
MGLRGRPNSGTVRYVCICTTQPHPARFVSELDAVAFCGRYESERITADAASDG